MTHAVELIASALVASDPDHPPLPDVMIYDEVCCVTGNTCRCVPRRQVLGAGFVDQARLVAPGSQYIGLDAYIALRYKWERMASWLACGSEFRMFRGATGRIELRKLILDGQYPAKWAGFVTTGFKKHGALKTPVNGPGRAVWLYNDMVADLSNHRQISEWWNRLLFERTNGLSRGSLETLDASPFAISQVGAARWSDLVSWAKPIHKSGAYQLLCYLLPSKEELKCESIS